MAIIGASDGAAFAKSTGTKTRLRYDDEIELASPNLLSNPDLRDFDGGDPENIVLGAPKDPQGWGVLVRKVDSPDKTSYAMQTAGPLDMDRQYYYQDRPLVPEGSPGLDRDVHAKIARPDAPRLKVVDRTPNGTGLKAGWRGIAYGYVVDDNRGRKQISPYITQPGPRITVQMVSDGQRISVPLPDDVPDGVVGIYIAMTTSQASQNDAGTATLWMQRRIPVVRGTRETFVLDGPMRKEQKAPGTNQTNWGSGNNFGKPNRKYIRSNKKINGFKTKLGWQYKTEFGWSKPMEHTNEINTNRFKDKRVRLAWRPRNYPLNAIAWRPIYQANPSEVWYALHPRPLKKWASIGATNPEKFHEGNQPEEFENNRFESEPDATGIDPPDSALDEATIVGRPSLPAGRYGVRVVWYDEDGRETRPSQESLITTTADQDIQVFRPWVGNLVPNDDLSELLPDGSPRGWTIGAAAGMSVVADKGRIMTTMSSLQPVATLIAETPWMDIPPKFYSDTMPIGVRFRVNVTSRSGTGGLIARIVYRSGAGSGTVATGGSPIVNSTGVKTIKFSVGETGSGEDVIVPASQNEFKIRFETVTSTVDMDFNITNVGKFLGKGRPRSYPRKEEEDHPKWTTAFGEKGYWVPLESAQSDDDPFVYRRHGVCKLSKTENNTRHGDLHTAVATIYDEIKSVSYWAPWDTPSANEYGIRGYKTPITPGDYVFSWYMEYDGIQTAANILYLVTKDVNGDVVDDIGWAALVGGTLAMQRHEVTFTASEDAAFFEIVRGGFSDGYLELMAFQLEEDNGSGIAGPYFNYNEQSGNRVYTFDTYPPIVEEGTNNEFLGYVEEWVDGGALWHEDPTDEVGDVTVDFRSSDTKTGLAAATWHANFSGTPKKRYWQVRVNLTRPLGYPAASPRVSFVGLEFFRPYGSLLRDGGTEFSAPVQAINVPVPTPQRQRVVFTSDNQAQRFSLRGLPIYELHDFTLETYTDQAARDVNWESNYSTGMLEIEDPDSHRRYVIWLNEVPRWEVDREINPGYWLHRAEGLSAIVVERESLTGEAIDLRG
jgi:hypothetical protein